jgi:hypothetical protein
MEKGINIEKMGRTEILFELAKHAHNSWYKDLIYWKTKWLRLLLQSYMEKSGFTIEIGCRLIEMNDRLEVTKCELFEVTFLEI